MKKAQKFLILTLLLFLVACTSDVGKFKAEKGSLYKINEVNLTLKQKYVNLSYLYQEQLQGELQRNIEEYLCQELSRCVLQNNTSKNIINVDFYVDYKRLLIGNNHKYDGAQISYTMNVYTDEGSYKQASSYRESNIKVEGVKRGLQILTIITGSDTELNDIKLLARYLVDKLIAQEKH